jgi:hypothetical protein
MHAKLKIQVRIKCNLNTYQFNRLRLRKTLPINNCLLLKGNSFALLHASGTKPEVLASFALPGNADTRAHEDTGLNN